MAGVSRLQMVGPRGALPAKARGAAGTTGNPDGARRSPRAVRMAIIPAGWRPIAALCWALVLAGLLAYVACLALGIGRAGGTAGTLVNDWLANALPLAAAAACLGRAALVRRERLAWGVLGAGILSWTLGNLYWTLALVDLPEPPFPSLADALWLG